MLGTKFVKTLAFGLGLFCGVCGTLVFSGRYSAISVKTERDRAIGIIYDRFTGRSIVIGDFFAERYFPQYLDGGLGITDDIKDGIKRAFDRKPKEPKTAEELLGPAPAKGFSFEEASEPTNGAIKLDLVPIDEPTNKDGFKKAAGR